MLSRTPRGSSDRDDLLARGVMLWRCIADDFEQAILVGKHENKLRIAARRGVETITVNEAGKRPSQFDVTVEASGSSSGFALAQQLLQPRGILVLKSTFHGKTEIDAAPLVVNEISVVGSLCGRFAHALELLKNGVVDVESLVDDLFPLTSGVTAMQRASQPGVLKILLRP